MIKLSVFRAGLKLKHRPKKIQNLSLTRPDQSKKPHNKQAIDPKHQQVIIAIDSHVCNSQRSEHIPQWVLTVRRKAAQSRNL